MKACKLVSLVSLILFSGCGGGGGSDGYSGGITASADNGSTINIAGGDNINTTATGGSTINNNIGSSQQDNSTLADDCATCCDLCDGSAGVDAECRQKCVDDLGCADVIDKAPQCAATSAEETPPADEMVGIINPAVS